MNSYEKRKHSVLNYLHSEKGRQHMKEAQKRYLHTEAGRQKNREIRMKSYYKTKAFNDEIKRLSAIELY